MKRLILGEEIGLGNENKVRNGVIYFTIIDISRYASKDLLENCIIPPFLHRNIPLSNEILQNSYSLL